MEVLYVGMVLGFLSAFVGIVWLISYFVNKHDARIDGERSRRDCSSASDPPAASVDHGIEANP